MAPTRVELTGGPWDGRTLRYNTPIPAVLVLAEYVPADDRTQPGLRYHDYRRVYRPAGQTPTYRHTPGAPDVIQ